MGDLIQDILLLIIGNLSAVDLIQFRAVCKNWRMVAKNKLIKLKSDMEDRNLPWLCTLSWASDHSNRLESEFFDPTSHVTFKSWTSMQKRNDSDNVLIDYGSKQGWFITGSAYKRGWSIFMHNPYTKEIIKLPCMKYTPCAATFSGDPISDVFVICSNRIHGFRYVAICSLNRGRRLWRIKYVEYTRNECIGVEYSQRDRRRLFCLFENSNYLKTYDLASEDWWGYRPFFPHHMQKLINFRGDVILVACDNDSKLCSTSYLDRCSRRKYDSVERVYISGSTGMVKRRDCTCFLVAEKRRRRITLLGR